ncbi:MAG: DNA polymerase III subunit delta [Pseudomonadota bacterium]
MAELSYEAFLSRTDGAALPESPVYLVHGDGYRTEDICGRLLKRLVGDGSRDYMVERLEGADDVLNQALEHLNTFALLAGRKIVMLPDARFFLGKQDAGPLLLSAQKAYKNDQKRKAGLHLMKYMALTDMSPDDDDSDTRQALTKAISGATGDAAWVDDLLAYCRENAISPPSGEDSPLARLECAVEKGFPSGNVLIITAERVDKRKSLYKAIADNGTIIDCRLPAGDRMADRKVQEQALSDTAERLLKASGKTLAPDARKILNDRIGCDLRLYAGNLEKLITYSGERATITAADVRHLVSRTRQEPIYALTTALAERNAPEAVLLLRRMMADEMIHPLQALAAISNQVRRLIVAREFIDSSYGRGWRTDLPYPVFTQQIMPALLAFQDHLDDALAAVETPAAATEKKAPPKRRGKSGFPAELQPARNPKSPFPVYQLVKHASAFTMADLVSAMGALAAADGDLKSQGGGLDSAPLEKVIFAIAAPPR